MAEIQEKSSFDSLVAGLSAQERTAMLARLNRSAEKEIEIADDPNKFDKYNGDLKTRLQNESLFYRIFLWIKSLFTKESQEVIYNSDVLVALAKKANREHPGIVNPSAKTLDSLFYEQLNTLKEAADFLRPYLNVISNDPGEFYVFLSSFVAPEISDQINKRSDPYSLNANTTITPDVRSDLLRRLDDILSNLPDQSRDRMYVAIKTVQWLNDFSNLPYLHFIAQFTDIRDGVFSCPYASAKVDYQRFSTILNTEVLMENEILEAIFLFSQKKDLATNFDSDVEKAVKKFMAALLPHLANIKMFVSVIPTATMGKIIFQDYGWQPGVAGGAEDWFPKFRLYWRKIIEIRWTEYIRDRKKVDLEESLAADFGINSFPEIPFRPWAKLWGGVPFGYELIGGYLAWFCTDRYPDIRETLNTIIMEGVFLKSENRTEFSEALDIFNQAANGIIDLVNNLAPKGTIGKVFEEVQSTGKRNFKLQSTIDSLISEIESVVHNSEQDFCKSIRILEIVFKGIFEELKDGIHLSLQNLNTLRGHENAKFRDSMKRARQDLKETLFYLSELEPIDSPMKK